MPPGQELCCLPRAQGQPSMLISVVQEASGMCCPLYGEIACGDPVPSPASEWRCSVLCPGTPPPINDLLEHPLPERESGATTAFSRFIETQGLTLWFGASSAHQGAPYILRQAVTKAPSSWGPTDAITGHSGATVCSACYLHPVAAT